MEQRWETASKRWAATENHWALSWTNNCPSNRLGSIEIKLTNRGEQLVSFITVNGLNMENIANTSSWEFKVTGKTYVLIARKWKTSVQLLWWLTRSLKICNFEDDVEQRCEKYIWPMAISDLCITGMNITRNAKGVSNLITSEAINGSRRRFLHCCAFIDHVPVKSEIINGSWCTSSLWIFFNFSRLVQSHSSSTNCSNAVFLFTLTVSSPREAAASSTIISPNRFMPHDTESLGFLVTKFVKNPFTQYKRQPHSSAPFIQLWLP